MQPPPPSQLTALQGIGEHEYDVPEHVPPEQRSLWLQALPSLQPVPSRNVVVHDAVPLQLRAMQGGLPVQVIGVPPHEPAPLHASPYVQRLPSLQVVPAGAGGLEQAPVAGLHVPAVKQAPSGVQVTVDVGEPHAPPRHVSPDVQALPSLHAAPSFRVTVQLAVPLHVRVVQVSLVHTTGVPAQTPDPLHTSVCVQALPSLQVVPVGAGGFEHTPVAGLQVPATWQASSGVQVTVDVGVPHVPAVHRSPVVQRLPSLHGEPSGRGMSMQAPVTGSHAPGRWQSLRGGHITVEVGGVQIPAAQSSPAVQALPSSQDRPHEPQFAGSVASSASQPFVADPSQSA